MKTSGDHLRADSVHHRREGTRGRSDPAPSGAERSVGTDSGGGGERGLLRLPMCEWLRLATKTFVIRRALACAIVVGSILIAINHGDAVIRGDVSMGRFGCS